MAVILKVNQNGQTTTKRITTGLGNVQNIKRILNFMYPEISTEQDPDRQRKRDEEARAEYLQSIND